MHDQLFTEAYAFARRAARARLATPLALRSVDRAECEDIEQELLVHTWKALRYYDPVRGSLRAFVERIVLNRLVSLLRSLHRKLKFESLKNTPLPDMSDFRLSSFRLTSKLS